MQRQNPYQQHFHEIIDFLFLGDSKSIFLQSFDMMVNCTKETEVDFPVDNNALCIRISIKDDPYDSSLLLSLLEENQLLEKIKEYIDNKTPVLVHCSKGMQRSCAVVACFLIQYYQMNAMEAIEYIRKKRPIAFFGNVNFLSAIESFYIRKQREMISV